MHQPGIMPTCVPICGGFLFDYDLRMLLYLVLVWQSPVSDVIYGLSVRVMCDVYGMWCKQEYALSECEDLLPSV